MRPFLYKIKKIGQTVNRANITISKTKGYNWSKKKPWHPSDFMLEECEPFDLTAKDNQLLKLFVGDVNDHIKHNELTDDERITFYDLPRAIDNGTCLGVEVDREKVKLSCVRLSGKNLDELAATYELTNGEERISTDQKVVDAVQMGVDRFTEDYKSSLSGLQKLPVGVTVVTDRDTKEEMIPSIKLDRNKHSDRLKTAEIARKLKKALKSKGNSLQKTFRTLHMPELDLKAVVPDSTATMIAGHWLHDKITAGLLIGDTLKASYISDTGTAENLIRIRNGRLDKLGDSGELEYLRTQHDVSLDWDSENPGSNKLEKLVCDSVLGEVVRLALIKLTRNNDLFLGQVTGSLMTKNILSTNQLARIQQDEWGHHTECRRVLDKLDLLVTRQDCVDARWLTEAVVRRSAHLVAGVISVLGRGGGCCLDGTLLDRIPGYFNMVETKALQLLPSKDLKIVHIPRSSAIGAALIAARIDAIDST